MIDSDVKQLAESNTNATNITEGLFTVCDSEFRTSMNQGDYIRLSLENAYKRVVCNCWMNNYSGPLRFNANEVVMITGKEKKLNSPNETVDVYSADVVTPTRKDALTTIPESLVGHSEDLHRLIDLVESICSDELRGFIYEVFSSREFALPFCTIAATHNPHHSIEGGLLKHSLECAEIVADCPYLDIIDRDIGTVAALFHDAGIILPRKMGRNACHIKMIDTLKVLHWPLLGLDHDCPNFGKALRDIWSLNKPIKHWGYKEKMPIATVVQMANRISTELDMQKQLFSAVEPWRNNVKHPITDQRFWRQSGISTSNSEPEIEQACLMELQNDR
ncbi:hypothetical protein Ga0123461_1249 [Mariprofundus aestuarium]|uniref:HD domain-containing protein n=1 Tax=Mariprofundus aestuarium TaxID=1921086 RepID=A0A2K8KXK9_MARES|nr:hypothetical protein [Mariprofundus aestuarium]ATX79668.1 hypothetical protein Ga0123461_1249 [Mariprofundus aestuarium]